MKSEKDKYDITHMWNLILNDINELIYKSETDSQTSKTNLRLQKGKHGGRRDELGAWDKYALLYITIDNQHEPAVEHRELSQNSVITYTGKDPEKE